METSNKNKFKLNTISEALEDIKQGKVIIVVDDENRENEGDFVAAAEMVTPEMINFMATHGRGLICAPRSEEHTSELQSRGHLVCRLLLEKKKKKQNRAKT